MSFNAVNSLVNLWGQGVEGNIPENWFQEINRKELKVLEIGFGKGSLLKRLSNENGPKLFGVEASQQNYRHAQDSLKVDANLFLIDISKERIPLPDGSVDVCILCEVLEHVLSPLAVVQEIQRVLKKDGIFYYSWPEERLISGIGMDENQENRSHGVGFHSFPYPALFRYDNMRVFFNQIYFKIIDEEKIDYHIFFKMINTKKDAPEILDVVNGDYDKVQLYGDIETPYKFPELVPYLNKK
jgi:SAM-dependent methyltransferase